MKPSAYRQLLAAIKLLRSAILATSLLLLVACGDSSDSVPGSGANDAQTPERQQDLLLFHAFCCSGEGHRGRLFTFTVDGETRLISEIVEEHENVGSVDVSPDLTRVVYRYNLPDRSIYLNVVDISSAELLFHSSDFTPKGFSARWSPDSQRLMYFKPGASGTGGTLSSVDVSTSAVTELASGIAGYDLSADGSLLAVRSTSNGEGQTPVSNIRVTEINGGGDWQTVDSVAGAGNYFNFAWSPYANELLYQALYYYSIDEKFGPGNEPAGPFMLMNAARERSQVLPQNEQFPAPNLPYIWLNEELILLPKAGAFMVVTRDGHIRHEQSISDGSLVVPSPDGSLLAYLESTEGAIHAARVRILNLATGGIHTAGPASDYWLGYGSYDSSILRWSEDGKWLAWNRRMSYDAKSLGELYVFNAQTYSTQLINASVLHFETFTTPFQQTEYSRFGGGWTWMRGESLLEYVAEDGAGMELKLADPANQSTFTIGTMAANLSANCNYVRTWRSRNELLWNQCGDGVYHSVMNSDQQITSEKIYALNFRTAGLSKNLEFVLATARDPDMPAGNVRRLVFDFIEGNMLELKMPEGHSRPNGLRFLQ